MIPSFLLKEALVDRHTYYVGWDSMGTVRKPVQQRGGKMFLSHHGIPITEFEVGGDNDRATFVERRAELKEEIGPVTVKGNEAEFIQDQEILLTDSRHKARELQLMLSREQVIDEGGDIVEVHVLALPTGG